MYQEFRVHQVHQVFRELLLPLRRCYLHHYHPHHRCFPVQTVPVLFLLVQTEQVVRLVLAIRRVRSGRWLRNLTDEVAQT